MPQSTNSQQLDFDTYLKSLLTYKPNPAFVKPIVRERQASKPQGVEVKPLPQVIKDSSKIVVQLRKAADSLQGQIEQKLNPAIANQRVTARRARIADGMAADGHRLQQVQAKLYALADAQEAGTISPLLSEIRHRSQVELLLWHGEYPTGQWPADSREKLSKLGITPANFNEAQQAFDSLGDTIKDDPIEAKIKKLERDLLGLKIPGFFPTPKTICKMMVDRAEIQPGDTILEPSAGKGNISEVIREQYPDNPLFVIEWQNRLSEILTLKGFTVIGFDFLECCQQFDRIIMNPPFEKFQDIDHVYHAYNLLNPGGILVSIMSESPFFRSDTKAVEFREWLSGVGYDEKLPPGSFSESGTGVTARMVVISKGY